MNEDQRRAVQEVLDNIPKPTSRADARRRLAATGIWNKDGSLKAAYGGGSNRPPR